MKHLNVGGPLVTMALRKSMTPSVMLLVLILGLMGLLLLLFPLSLSGNVLYCIVQSCNVLYDTLLTVILYYILW